MLGFLKKGFVTKKMMEGIKSDTLIVAAIDIGTSYSGWAFSFNHEFNANPAKVSAKNWQGGSLISLKAPTSVLIKPDGKTLEAFGYEAEDRFAELIDEKDHGKYFYFEHFKMLLNGNTTLQRNAKLEDVKGKVLPAMTVFSLAISYLKNDLVATCRNRVPDISESDIHWVLTVPAIWNDAAKQFMREAAENGGIDRPKLSIALEPEAASIYCRLTPMEKTESRKGMSLSGLKPRAKYMVLDAGGGTIDITVHELLGSGKVRELHSASGGPWGGTRVDEAFLDLIRQVVGTTELKKFKVDNAVDYFDMMRDFEIKKRTIQPDKNKKIVFRLPVQLNKLFEKNNGLIEREFGSGLVLKGDKLSVDGSIMKGLFTETITKIMSHLNFLLTQPKIGGINTILMVGGFSESPMLQTAVRSNFLNIAVVIPDHPGLSVLKGAVVFGHNPKVIAERVCRFTYGIGVKDPFISGEHNPDFKIVQDGVTYCEHIFSKHVTVEQCVAVGVPQTSQTYTSPFEDATRFDVDLLASPEKNPKYTKDNGVKKIGTLSVKVTDRSVSYEEREFDISLTFGGTEIEVSVVEKVTGKVTAQTFDFLKA